MARYTDEFMGYYSDAGPARGADPNYRGGAYRGMRTRAGAGQAPYGTHRTRHPMDFEGSGGPYGRHGGAPGYASDFEGPYHPPHRGHAYDRDWQGGGVHDPRFDPEYLRDFNAYSPRLRGEGHGGARPNAGHPRYDEPYDGHPGDRFSARYRGYQRGYGNRGLSSGGYTEGWAWGPMRGSR